MPEYKVEHLSDAINQPFTDYAPQLRDNTLYYGSWISDDVKMDNKVEKYATFSRIYAATKNASGFGNILIIFGPKYCHNLNPKK